MKRILALLLCLLTLFAVGCQKESGNDLPDSNEGNADTIKLETFKEDGLNQITGRKIDNIYLADGKIHYTFVNNTDVDSGVGPYSVTVEKWENEQWTYYPLLSGSAREIWQKIAAHKDADASRTLHLQAVTPGKYRLVSGYEIFSMNSDGSTRVTRSEDRYYWVGYFTITEEQAAVYPDFPSHIYYAAGVYQSKNVSLSLAAIEHHLYLYEFSIQNTGDKNLIIPISDITPLGPDYFDEMMYLDEEKEYLDHVYWQQRFPEGGGTVAPGESLKIPLCSNVGGDAADRYVPTKDGHYLYRLPCYFEGDEENFFYAVIFFEVKDGQIA